MKKLIVLPLAFIALSYTTGEPTEVYICDSKTASKYHFKEDCTGLEKCIHDIRKVTVAEAKNTSFTKCALE